MAFFAIAALGAKIIGGVVARKSAKTSLKRAKRQQDEANRLNEERFQRILANFRQRETEARSLFNQLQGSGETEIRNRALEARSQSQQSLVSRGLANTSRLETEREGIGSRETEAIERLRQSLVFQRIGTLGEFQRQRLAFQERKIVQGPTAQQIGLLQQQKAKATQQIISGFGGLGTAFGSTFGGGGSGGGTSFSPASGNLGPVGRGRAFNIFGP